MLEIAQFGQFLSGLAFLMTAGIAILTLFFYHRKQLDDAWLDRFRDLYKEFWSDKDMQIARHLLNNGEGYRELEPILARRNAMGNCDVPFEDYKTLEMMDKFCSVLVRVRSFGKSIAMSEVQEEIWGELLYNFWIKRIMDRAEMKHYVERHWSRLLLPIQVERRKKYIIL